LGGTRRLYAVEWPQDRASRARRVRACFLAGWRPGGHPPACPFTACHRCRTAACCGRSDGLFTAAEAAGAALSYVGHAQLDVGGAAAPPDAKSIQLDPKLCDALFKVRLGGRGRGGPPHALLPAAPPRPSPRFVSRVAWAALVPSVPVHRASAKERSNDELHAFSST
jgi:hypothetical protein